MKKIGKKIAATFANILFWDNKLWFTEWDCNELYCYNLKKQQVEIFCKFEEEKEYRTNLFGGIIPYKDYLYVFPASASNLYRVNIVNREIKKIELKFDKLQSVKNKAKFISAHIQDGKLYLIGAALPLIIEYNCESEELIYIFKELNFLQKNNIFHTSIFVRKTLLLNKKIYIPLCQKNWVGIFDTKDRKVTYHKVGSTRCGYSSICGVDGEHFWLAPRDKGPIVYWNIKTGQWKELDFPTDFVPSENSFMSTILWNDSVWAFPLCAKGIWKVDCKENRVTLFDGVPVEANRVETCCSDRKLFCFSIKENRLYVIDATTNYIESTQIFLPDETVKYHIDNQYDIKLKFGFCQNEGHNRCSSFTQEREKAKLQDYLMWLKEQKFSRKEKYSEIQIGQAILSRMI